MKTAVLCSLLVGSVSAFAPAAPKPSSASTSTSIKAFEDEVGAAVMSGQSYFWDPLGFVTDEASFKKMRASEIKHCRVAMLAWLGFATTWHTDYRFPGCEEFPGGHAAVLAIPPVDLLVPIFAICGALEVIWKQKEGSFPGDMSGTFFPVGFGPFANNEEEKVERQTNEILNGRAAMMGWLTLLVHEQIDGKPFIFFDHITPFYPGPVAI